VGTESLQETLDIQLAETTDTSYLKECINSQLPQGIEVISVDDIPSGKKKVSIKETHFNITIAGAELKEEDLKIFLESDNFPIVKKTKKGERNIDARSLVNEICLTESGKIELVLKHTEGPQLKPEEIIAGIFLSGESVGSHLRIVKTKQELA
jgi:radical SAM-linked protein